MCKHCHEIKDIKKKKKYLIEYEELMKEFNWEANEGLDPSKLTHGSDKSVWWQCQVNPEHKWKTSIRNRTKTNGTNCPYCSKTSSIPEYAIKYYLEQLNIKVSHRDKRFGFELDLYLPDLKIGIEYDGYIWHKDKEKKDLEKNTKCEKLGIVLYRIRDRLQLLNSTSIDILYNYKKESLTVIINKLLDYIYPTHNLNVDFEKDEEIITKLKKSGMTGTLITVYGITKNLSQWARYFGLSNHAISEYARRHGLENTRSRLEYLYNNHNNQYIHIKKEITVYGQTKNLRNWSRFFGYNNGYFSYYLNKYGMDYIKKMISDLYIKKCNGQDIHIHKQGVHYLSICNEVKTYQQWSLYFEHERHYVGRRIKTYGLEETVKYLTELYLKKQKQESTKKDNIVA